MSLADEIRAAEAEVLQEAWDRHLVVSWLRYGDYRVGKSFAIFCMKNGGAERVEALRDEGLIVRVPVSPFHLKMRVRRFVAAHLPRLSGRLFDKFPDVDVDDSLAFIVRTGEVLTEKPVDSAKYGVERKEMRKTSREYAAEIASHELVRDQRYSTSRSNWSACK